MDSPMDSLESLDGHAEKAIIDPSYDNNMDSVANQRTIEAYYNRPPATIAGKDEDWLSMPEVPDTAEIERELLSLDPRVPDNNIKGNWSSKEEHLGAQYQFLREEATFALRRAIGLIKSLPYAHEPDLKEDSPGIGIYEKVFVTGVTLARRGLGVRMCFSTFRTGVKIDWLSSKRLTAGSLIALSPTTDRFRKSITVGIVAARPLFLLNGPIPEIDIFFPCPEEMILDPAEEYMMLEETSSFFEAQRHNMLAMQRMIKEETPLQEYIITPSKTEATDTMNLIDLSNMTLSESDTIHRVHTPQYVQDDPVMKLEEATGNPSHREFNVVNSPPPPSSALLDDSQMQALHQMLTKELALIQGPPGTGKTHVSVIALRIMIDKIRQQRLKGEFPPPLIVACQTNHALDQLLRHIATFEDSFVRLGGRSADTGVVKSHTLHNIKEARQESGMLSRPKALGEAHANVRRLENEMKRALAPFDESRKEPGPMDEAMFTDHLTAKHIDSIRNSEWQTSEDSTISETSAIVKWLGPSATLSSSRSRWVADQEFGFETFEEEEEAVDEATAEKSIQDDEIEKLRGSFIPLVDHSIINLSSTKRLTHEQVKKLLNNSKFSNLEKIPPHYRAELYWFFVQDVKKKVIEKVRGLAVRWNRDVVERSRVGRYAQELEILQEARAVGLTVTGFAKYRPMIHSLNPRIVLIEEAGECLEANMMSVLLPSLQHLILVGDHQQLRPRAQKATHNRQHYDVSLFERLAGNKVDYRMLAVQRRMPPEVRRLLWPIYGDGITDHPCTFNRPPVPTFADRRTTFFHHRHHEQQDSLKSTYNEGEAELIVGFVNGTIEAGTQPDKITILTFYNGQRRLLNRKLRDIKGLGEMRIKVVTVDSYQGEENDIVVLSLVRNNFTGTVGFLNVANRVCVALSRARHGMIMFGNVQLLEESGGPEWQQVISILRGEGPPETKKIVRGTRIVDTEQAEGGYSQVEDLL